MDIGLCYLFFKQLIYFLYHVLAHSPNLDFEDDLCRWFMNIGHEQNIFLRNFLYSFNNMCIQKNKMWSFDSAGSLIKNLKESWKKWFTAETIDVIIFLTFLC